MNHVTQRATAAACLLAVGACATERAVKMSDLPFPVQKAISEHSQGSVVRGISTEKTDGKTVYEAELRVGDLTRDITFDAAGTIVSQEDEVSISEIPAAARAAIEAGASGGTLTRVEAVTEHGATFYEAQIDKSGRTSEIKVDSAGRPVK